MVGGIRRAAAGGRTALVLVTGLGQGGLAAVTLLSPDLEFGGALDLPLAPADTGAQYGLLVESDLAGYVDPERLGPELGRVATAVLRALQALRDDDVVGWQAAGPPVLDRADPRWRWKLGELGRLRDAVG